MVVFREEHGFARHESGPAHCLRGHRAAVWLLLMLAAMTAMPGCGGCTKDPIQSQRNLEAELARERAKKKPKEDFEVGWLTTRPSDGYPPAEQGEEPEPERVLFRAPYKPGHWTALTLPAKTNNFDFVGDLELSVVNRKGKSIPLESVPFDLTTRRQAALPKGQPKLFESVLFVPATSQEARVNCQFVSHRGSGRDWQGRVDALLRMPSYQYHMVVLARWPQRYTFLRGLAAVEFPSDDFVSASQPHYRVALMAADRRLALPSHSLLWTSVAYVLWDDAEPSALDPDQQRALLDWLHWGGQLILSGPETLDTLRNSFLGPYLPATASGSRELSAADFLPMHDWSIGPGTADKSVPALKPVRPLAGVALQKHPQARYVPGSGELLVERGVGRGRITVSAFRLSERDLTAWAGFDEMFNSLLLRCPSRQFRLIRDQLMQEASKSPQSEDRLGQIATRLSQPENVWQVSWADLAFPRLDARHVSQLRYFTRDTGVLFADYGADVRTTSQQEMADPNFDPPAGPGVAAWNDFGPVARAARKELTEAAQIEIPDRRFVLWMIGVYLAVLVPANWLVFRLLGRVEWAWGAAPIIAIVGTIVVIRMAQLDIGFARSRTEVAVVELQGDYARAHVSRYIALYTSLATSYDFRFDDPGAVVQPFPAADKPGDFQPPECRNILYRYGDEADLSDVFVKSNNTGMMHSEQMVDLGGGLSLATTAGGRLEVTNRTKLPLHDAEVVKHDASGNRQIAWLGTLEPGAKAAVRFDRPAPAREKSVPPGTVAGRQTSGDRTAAGPLRLHELVQLSESAVEPGRADLRLLARIDRQIPGLTIKPAAPQSRQVALLVAHLDYGPGDDPRPDVNVGGKQEKKQEEELGTAE